MTQCDNLHHRDGDKLRFNDADRSPVEVSKQPPRSNDDNNNNQQPPPRSNDDKWQDMEKGLRVRVSDVEVR